MANIDPAGTIIFGPMMLNRPLLFRPINLSEVTYAGVERCGVWLADKVEGKEPTGRARDDNRADQEYWESILTQDCWHVFTPSHQGSPTAAANGIWQRIQRLKYAAHRSGSAWQR